MSTSVVANRIYHKQKVSADDFALMMPDTVLVRGCKPPKQSEGGLVFLDSKDDHPVRACCTFEIVRMPADMSRGNPLGLAVGDVVHCRNALVDPLYGNELGITDLYMGVIGLAERAPVAPALVQ